MKANSFTELSEAAAIEIQKSALEAIRVLTALLKLEPDLSTADFETLKREIGLIIGKIDCDILCKVYEKFPEMDHLKQG